MKRWLMFLSLLVVGTAAQAATRIVTLSLPTMDCPVCPITVKKALGRVRGVSRAEVDFAGRRATVSYDDGMTDVEALTRATREAGYPSVAIETPK